MTLLVQVAGKNNIQVVCMNTKLTATALYNILYRNETPNE